VPPGPSTTKALDLALTGALITLLAAITARAELVALDIQRGEPFAGGASFGKTGPYEQIVGVAHSGR
jgi:hypothetical protein